MPLIPPPLPNPSPTNPVTTPVPVNGANLPAIEPVAVQPVSRTSAVPIVSSSASTVSVLDDAVAGNFVVERHRASTNQIDAGEMSRSDIGVLRIAPNGRYRPCRGHARNREHLRLHG